MKHLPDNRLSRLVRHAKRIGLTITEVESVLLRDSAPDAGRLALSWCQQQPGEWLWDYDFDDDHAIMPTEARFYFTDKSVAFEFKLRFG